MGCFGYNPKLFSKMDDDKKQKVIEEMEKQDENLKLYISGTTYDDYNWDQIIKNIPCEKDKKEKRKEIFKKFNNLSEIDYISYKRLKHGFSEYYDLPDLIVKKEPNPIYLALKAANSKFYRDFNYDILEFKCFRLFLFYLKQYFSYLNMFKEQAKYEKRLITLDQFKNAIPTMKEFGIKIEENEAEKVFNKIDLNGEKKISFDDFCIIIQKSIDDVDEDYKNNIEDLTN